VNITFFIYFRTKLFGHFLIDFHKGGVFLLTNRILLRLARTLEATTPAIVAASVLSRSE
jgi:hypothetical protein